MLSSASRLGLLQGRPIPPLPSNLVALAHFTTTNVAGPSERLPAVCVFREPAALILLFTSRVLACYDSNALAPDEITLLFPLSKMLSLGLEPTPLMWCQSLTTSLRRLVNILPATEAALAIRYLAKLESISTDQEQQGTLLAILHDICNGHA